MFSWLATKFGKADHGSATMSVVETSMPTHAATKLVLPQRRDDVEDWVPPPRRKAPAKAQAEALVALFQSEGRAGPIPHWELTANYPECAWVQGFVQLSERQLLHALSQVCAKVRRPVDIGDGTMLRVICYVIPEPAWSQAGDRRGEPAGNVVAMAPKRAKPRLGVHARFAPRKQNRGQPGIASLPKNGWQRKGGSWRADIVEAVAYR